MIAHPPRALLLALFVVVCSCLIPPGALADGTETLDPPSVAILSGTAVAGDGTGLHDSQPGVVTFFVPDGALVTQVLLYWNGFHSCAPEGELKDAEPDRDWPYRARSRRAGAAQSMGLRKRRGGPLTDGGGGCIGGDDTLMVRKAGGGFFQPVTGTLIGGPTEFWSGVWSSTYRADITHMDLVSDGANLIEIQGSDFDRADNGASIVALYDDGSPFHDIQVRDGQDLAYIAFAPTLDTTVEQTFSFTPSSFDRLADLLVLAGSVRGPVSGSDPIRPNVVEMKLYPGPIPDDRVDVLQSNQGDEWDHHWLQVYIPANTDTLTVKVLSADPFGSGMNPASLAWIGAVLDLPPENDCNIRVLKTCFVEDAPQGGDDCRDEDDDKEKLESLKFEYTAKGCGATTNDQGGQVECSGGATPADDPIDVVVTDKRGEVTYTDVQGVAVGGIFEVDAQSAGDLQLDNNIMVDLGPGIESIKIHTSCSQPIRVGDEFGSLRLVELTTVFGKVVTLNGGLPSRNECILPPPIEPPHCEGGLQRLSLNYEGGDCSETTNYQEGKFTCSGDAAAFTPVRIVAYKDAEVYLDSGMPASVALGDTVDLLASNAGVSKLASQTEVDLYNAAGDLIQELSIHTSCSKDLDLGDRFGAVEVVGMTLSDGTIVEQGGLVEYNYLITNDSPIAVVNVTVMDDQLGELPGSPIPIIAAGDSVELTVETELTETTRNVVTVLGSLENGETCRPARASALVILDGDPPPSGDVCYNDGRPGDGDDDDDDDDFSSGIEATELQYSGPAIPGPVKVELKADNFRNDIVIYEFPDGLTPGMVLSSPAENGFTIDANAHGRGALGKKLEIKINGAKEELHTSCSVPFASGAPAPLHKPRGEPSPTWWVVRFRD